MGRREAVIVLACLGLWLPVSAGVPLPPAAAPSQRVYPPDDVMSAEDRIYFNMGRNVDRSAKVIDGHLDRFERELGASYRALSTALQNHEGGPIGLIDQLTIRLHVRRALSEVRQAQDTLLDGLGVRAERTPLYPKAFYINGVSVYPGTPFAQLLYGLHDRGARYVKVGIERVRYGEGGRHLELGYPRFCFWSTATPAITELPAGVADFLRTPLPGFDPASLYDASVTHVREKTLRDGRNYGPAGVSESCGVSGEVVGIGGLRRMHIFPDMIEKDPKFRQYPRITALVVDQTRTHEAMHALLRPKCVGKDVVARYLVEGRQVTRRQLDEAQAAIATIAIFARNRPQDVPFVLLFDIRQSQTAAYALTYELFFKRLLKTQLQQQAASLKAESAASGGAAALVIPPYWTPVPQGRIGGMATNSEWLDVELTSAGKTRTYRASLDGRAAMLNHLRMLGDTPAADIMAAAGTALGVIGAAWNQCAPGATGAPNRKLDTARLPKNASS